MPFGGGVDAKNFCRNWCVGRGAASAQEQQLPSCPVPVSSQLAAVVAGQGHGDSAGAEGTRSTKPLQNGFLLVGLLVIFF